MVTDGDCEPLPGWVQQHVGLRVSKQAHFISAAVEYEPVSSLQLLLQLELRALVGIGAVGIAGRKPTMCNAANITFSKEAFSAVGGYERYQHITSGDDEFLLKKIFAWRPNAVYFLKSQEALVRTKAAESFKEFYNQRLRWAGKWKYHDGAARLTAVLLFGFYVGWLTLSFTGSVKFVVWAWLIKGVGDWFFLFTISRWYKLSVNFAAFFTLLLLYPFYVVFFALAANFGQYSWKDRKYTS